MTKDARTEHMVAALRMACLSAARDADRNRQDLKGAERHAFDYALHLVKEFATGIEMTVYKAESVLNGYRLLAKESGEPTWKHARNREPEPAAVRIQRAIDQDARGFPGVGSSSFLGLSVLCSLVDEMRGLPPKPIRPSERRGLHHFHPSPETVLHLLPPLEPMTEDQPVQQVGCVVCRKELTLHIASYRAGRCYDNETDVFTTERSYFASWDATPVPKGPTENQMLKRHTCGTLPEEP